MESKKQIQEVQFQIGELLGIGMTFVVLGVGLAYGLQVMGDVKTDMTANSAEYNATASAVTGVSKIPEKLPTIATVVIASVILGILMTYLYSRFAR
jgi:Na+-transporting methylmalonyl-CoA/oxaloacetate decarboxylase gamma subunit